MKSKRILTMMAVAVIMAGTVSGFILSDIFSDVSSNKKPVIEIGDKEKVAGSETDIIYEREYEKCGHTVVSPFDKAKDLEGKNIHQIRKVYSSDLGYTISWQGNTLIIHQRINQFCPADKDIYRLKEFQGMVAIYRGIEQEEVLERVTEIRMDSLPAPVQEDIRRDKFVFKDRDTLNDALENFDEYL